MHTYRAPWGTTLKIVSSAATLLLLGIAAAGARSLWQKPAGAGVVTVVLPLIILASCALMTVRGYTLTRNHLLVHRLLWTTKVLRSQVLSAAVQPKAMSGGLRLFGNGGLFSFSGWYRNRALGTYRAFVTDLTRTVVIHAADRTIVVSPEAPEAFVQELMAA